MIKRFDFFINGIRAGYQDSRVLNTAELVPEDVQDLKQGGGDD